MDDVNYFVLIYVVFIKVNVMGFFIFDLCLGEIFEVDIMWWYNVFLMFQEWIMV